MTSIWYQASSELLSQILYGLSQIMAANLVRVVDNHSLFFFKTDINVVNSFKFTDLQHKTDNASNPTQRICVF